MCLLVFAWQTERAYPLVVAANRDERLDRPARPICVLSERGPRIIGGRDELAGGTWLAVNEHGVVAGLTNRPAPDGRDLTKRSRGELPLLAAGQKTAEDAVAALLSRVGPGDYNPAWLLIGDRHSLHYVEVTAERRPTAQRLGPGVHVLENVALDGASPKADRVRGLVVAAGRDPEPWSALTSVMADHTAPSVVPADASGGAGPSRPRRAATLAACVHTDDYGTRSALLARVPRIPDGRPDVLIADGPPCRVPFADVGRYWCDDPDGPEGELRGV